MAGGNFDINTPKVRPGNYINFQAKQKTVISSSIRGTAVIPLVGYDWGPDGEFIKLTTEAPDGELAKLGRSIYSDNDLTTLIRAAFENASTVYVYIIAGGKKASLVEGGLTVTALYAGTRGNDIRVAISANVNAGFDVSIYMDTEQVELYEQVETIDELIAEESEYVVFSGEGDIRAFAAKSLNGGETAESTNASFVKYLDKIERVKFNTALIPVSEESLIQAAASKLKYLRTNIGKTIQFVFANYAGDNLGIINVINSFNLYDKDFTIVQAAAWVTGAEAGASKTTALTYKTVTNADHVIGELANEEAIDAIKAGKFFFSVDDEDNVIIETDINSLVNLDSTQDDSYKKNRVIRVFDSFMDDINILIPPAKYDNDPTGWKLMLGVGRALLMQYEDAGAVKNVDADNDFVIDASRSVGDSTYFNVGLQPVDASEKHYFSVSTQ